MVSRWCCWDPLYACKTGWCSYRVFESTLVCDLWGQVAGYQLSHSKHICVCASMLASKPMWLYLRVCQEPLHAHVGSLDFFLTYILLSTIGSKEICVNQRPSAQPLCCCKQVTEHIRRLHWEKKKKLRFLFLFVASIIYLVWENCDQRFRHHYYSGMQNCSLDEVKGNKGILFIL